MNADAHAFFVLSDLAVFLTAAAASFVLLLLLRPLLQRYALANPNARSSHTKPTPQGAGIGVVTATIATAAGAAALLEITDSGSLWLVLAASIFLAVIGAIDDVRPIPVLPRLFLQAAAVAIVIATLSGTFREVAALPSWLEFGLLGLAALWYVNLFNFMDGIDWMTVAETVPVSATIAFIGIVTGAPSAEIVVALALCGAVIGFAPFNRPVAKLFLGDVGSLAIGLLLAWLLLALAARGHIAAALLLPLYYLADATITLLQRAARGERIWQAHRKHFYQRAVQDGSTVMSVIRRVFFVNIGLAALAFISAAQTGIVTQLATLAVGVAMVSWLLSSLSARRST